MKPSWLIRGLGVGALCASAALITITAGCAKQIAPQAAAKPEIDSKVAPLPATQTSTPIPAKKTSTNGSASANGGNGKGSGNGNGTGNGTGSGTGSGTGNGSGSGSGNGTGAGSGMGTGSGSAGSGAGSAGAAAGGGAGGGAGGTTGAGGGTGNSAGGGANGGASGGGAGNPGGSAGGGANGGTGGGTGGGAGGGAGGAGSGASGGAGGGASGGGGAGGAGSGASGGASGGAGGNAGAGSGGGAGGGAGTGSGGGAGGNSSGSAGGGASGAASGGSSGAAGGNKGGGGAGGGADSGGSQSQLIKIVDAVNGNQSASNQPFKPKKVPESSDGAVSASGASNTGPGGSATTATSATSGANSASTDSNAARKDPAAGAGTVRRSGGGAGDSGIADANRSGAKKDDATNAGTTVQETQRLKESQAVAQPETKTETPATESVIPLPDVPDAATEHGDAAPEAAQMAAQSKYAPLLGYWKQVDASKHEPDFAPGGFDQSILAIRPTQRSMQIYRSWGAPAQLVIAAELRATFDLNGGVSMTENPATPCRFSPTALELPATSSQPARRVVPPAQPLPFDAKWAVEKDDMLQLDGKLYRRMERAEFEAATQSKPSIASSGGASAAASPSATTAATGQGSKEPSGGIDFFGTRVRGKYVCFVCDISGSMQGDKLIALRNELTRTIMALPSGSHFEVLFFSDEAFMLEPNWVLAGSAGANGFLKKIQEVGAGGGTDPSGALIYAFTKLNPAPHELFLLTDGHFNANPAELLKQLNGGADQTRIHTIGLGQDVDTAMLTAIANEYGGQYRGIAAQAAPPPAP